uniref:Uncharacterized protein n=1 Tax=Hyaloperonospora arabidopsidis (strain Emoy2) TaxID=559515 RepID=M4BA20_HYAAE
MTSGPEGSNAAATAKAKSAAKEQSIAQEREMVQQKLDEIVAFECMFCGEVMIKSIHLFHHTGRRGERRQRVGHLTAAWQLTMLPPK